MIEQHADSIMKEVCFLQRMLMLQVWSIEVAKSDFQWQRSSSSLEHFYNEQKTHSRTTINKGKERRHVYWSEVPNVSSNLACMIAKPIAVVQIYVVR
jgi:hypothetical protein